MLTCERALDYEGPSKRSGSRLLDFPRFRMRTVQPTGGLPYWELTPSFRMNEHLGVEQLPDSTSVDRRLQELLSIPLVTYRPPWDFRRLQSDGESSPAERQRRL